MLRTEIMSLLLESSERISICVGNTQSAVRTSVVVTGLERAKCFLLHVSLHRPTRQLVSLRNSTVNVNRETISDLRRNGWLVALNVAVYSV